MRATDGESSARPVVSSCSYAMSSVCFAYTQKLLVMRMSTPAPSSQRHFRSKLVSPSSRLNALYDIFQISPQRHKDHTKKHKENKKKSAEKNSPRMDRVHSFTLCFFV